MHNPLSGRRTGVLLHLTSLPGKRERGGLGQDAHLFIDFLHASGVAVWQMLPLGPTHADNSPYQCLSVHAGNIDLISLDYLVTEGWLSANAVNNLSFSCCLESARSGFNSVASKNEKRDYKTFKQTHACWLEDYALYQAIRQTQDHLPWYHWSEHLRDRQQAGSGSFINDHTELIEQICFEQYLFFRQWAALRDYAHQQGVALFGDMPIYVAHDSADVWANRDLFTVDSHGQLEVVAGVPPDYFSDTGQRWGNPLYRWDKLHERDFAWWSDRFRTQLALFDILRLDHFRGFEKYWEIPASAETAVDGRWVTGPGSALFYQLQQEFGELPLVAEDLGIITPEVDALRLEFNMPGMKILQFAFDGGSDNPYLPENIEPLSVVYTGTHDNDTSLGWYESLHEDTRKKFDDSLGHIAGGMPWALVEMALESDSELAIIPMQDLLALGSEHRMNIPGTTTGNWAWRFAWEQVTPVLSQRLHGLIERYGRMTDGSQLRGQTRQA